jgi:hypothetical protein
MSLIAWLYELYDWAAERKYAVGMFIGFGVLTGYIIGKI